MPSFEAVIIAHGSPSDPAAQDGAMADLAARVQALLPGWTVRGATLASSGSLARALDGMARPLIYPFFMAEGYFTGGVLPKRLQDMGLPVTLLPPFGAEPELPSLIASAASKAAREGGRHPGDVALLLAAHGSQVSPASRQSTEAIVRTLKAGLAFRTVAAGFIEEEPRLEDVARGLGPAICLPLFTLRAGHVMDDVPKALEDAGFEGMRLDPIGAHAEVSRLIAGSLLRNRARRAA